MGSHGCRSGWEPDWVNLGRDGVEDLIKYSGCLRGFVIELGDLDGFFDSLTCQVSHTPIPPHAQYLVAWF